MNKRSILMAILLVITAAVYGQTIKISGKINDYTDHTPLPGVGIIITNLNDASDKHLTSTSNDGSFLVTGIRVNSTYKLKTSFIGSQAVDTVIKTKAVNIDLGRILLKPESHVLNEVVIQGEVTPVIQKGDTTEMSAAAYKVNDDANAEDLVQKMPGITVENGVIKSHGEEIQRVMVDGKNFFGEDAAMALQNLPAEVIDKVQIYNKMSDQAEFTGFDDGNETKVLNIVTRADRRNVRHMTATAGHDNLDKYLVSGRLNAFNGDRKLTISGGTNNINQQSFSTQDLLGVMGETKGKKGGGFIGRQSGINSPASIGLNYSDHLGSKVEISGSYFFNHVDNFTNKNTHIQNIGSLKDSSKFPRYEQLLSNSFINNYNHRFDMKLEYTIDTLNSIIWSPRFSTQQNDNDGNSGRVKYNIWPDTVIFIDAKNGNEGSGFNYGSDLTFRHKFQKRGRTISLGVNTSGNLNNSDGLQYTETHYISSSRIINEKSESTTKGFTIASNLAYTEPLSTISNLQFSYNVSLTNNSADKYSYNQVTHLLTEKYSNVYRNNYNTYRGEISYRLHPDVKLMASAGLQYQIADMQGRRMYPKKSKVDQTFYNVLPNMSLDYRFSKKSNLKIRYRTTTDPPSIDQLQDVITASGTLNFRQGNPDLIHEYTHRGVVTFKYSNSENYSNIAVSLYGNYSLNSINNAIYYMTDSTRITSGDAVDTVPPGGQLIKPMNYNHSWDGRLFVNYGFLFKPIHCNINLVGGTSLSKTPGSINDVLRTTDEYNFTGGLVIASNISQNVDFTLSYTGNYTIANVFNHGDLSMFSNKLKSLNSDIWNHSISLTSNFVIGNRIVLQNTVNQQINRGLGKGYDQNFMLWNSSIGVKMFAKKAGQLRFSVYDVLNQNENFNHNVTNTSISDARVNTLNRFFMLTFTYTFRKYVGTGNRSDDKMTKKDYKLDRKRGKNF